MCFGFDRVSSLKGYRSPISRLQRVTTDLIARPGENNQKQTQTNPFTLNPFDLIIYLKKRKNKPIQYMSPEISCLPRILGLILRFLDEIIEGGRGLVPNAPAAPIAAEL